MAFVGHEACPACPSSDGYARYDDGGGHCFACGHHVAGCGPVAVGNITRPAGEIPVSAFTPLEGTFYALTKRGLNEDTCRHFGYRLGHYSGEEAQIADYHDAKGRLCAQHIRLFAKDFRWVGGPDNVKAAGFFGQRRASAAKAFRLYITEGEIDAMSVSQVKGHRWPVVSLKNGASGAAKEFAAQIDWLDQFREIVLCFDNDEPGERAAIACAELLPHKVKIARLPRKDANEMLVAGEIAALIEAIDGAVQYRPDGVVAAVDLIDAILVKPERGIAYPWECLNRLTYGQRYGEITTWCAGTGSGKSQALREVTRSLLRDHGQTVGVIALEEAATFTALSQVSLEMGLPLHIPEVRERVTDDAVRQASEVALKNLYLYATSDVAEAAQILPKIRFLVHGMGCRHIILDHLSIMVSGTASDGDERKRIDEIMTRLRSLTQELVVNVHVICHLRKPSGTPFEEGGQISLVDLRGSGAIAQISNTVIAMERHQQADDVVERNITRLRVLKNRFAGLNGEAGRLLYDPATGRLTEAPSVEPVMVEGVEVKDF